MQHLRYTYSGFPACSTIFPVYRLCFPACSTIFPLYRLCFPRVFNDIYGISTLLFPCVQRDFRYTGSAFLVFNDISGMPAPLSVFNDISGILNIISLVFNDISGILTLLSLCTLHLRYTDSGFPVCSTIFPVYRL